jgi:hypothetical protein
MSEAPNTVMTSSRQHHGFCSFFGLAREVAVLWILHSFTRFMLQNGQSFSCCLSHASLERPPQRRCLDHLANEANTIDRMPLIDHHTYTPMVWVLTKQPQGSNEERGLAISKRQKHCPQSPQKVASILTITVGLRRHNIPTRQHTNMLPCHLDKRRQTRVNNHQIRFHKSDEKATD